MPFQALVPPHALQKVSYDVLALGRHEHRAKLFGQLRSLSNQGKIPASLPQCF